MYYAAIDLIAILVLIIENQDILFGRSKTYNIKPWQVYRRFLFSVLIYYIVDVLWGAIEYYKMPRLLFADTTVYFIAMASSLVLWTAGVFYYLEAQGRFANALKWTGRIVATAITSMTVVNIFVPVLFTVDSDCVYHALPLRSMLLVAQILVLLLVSVYSFTAYIRVRDRGDANKHRYRTIGMFGVIVSLFLFIQLWFPYLPLYAIGYMLGTCLVRTFVINDEKERYKLELNENLKVMELTKTISSLLDNMPAMTFTKEPETRMYLACNQSFAEYAGKKRPEDVVGKTDKELFDEELAKRFAQDDRVAMSMDEPYIFIEDVADANGNPRQFQTAKLKYTDTFGRLCVLCMAHETTDIAQVRREFASTKEEYEKAKVNAVIYSHISQALAYGYDELFYVYLDTEDYINFGVDDKGQLVEKRRGPKFFDSCQVEVNTLVCEEDRDKFRKAMVRDTLLAEIDRKKSFDMTYRVPKDGESFWVRMRASRMLDNHDVLVIGVDDVNEEMKIRRAQDLLREADLTRRLSIAEREANRDALTGVKTKRAYLEFETRLENTIKEGQDVSFAISILDINDLKQVNDTFGHQAGDQYIKDACQLVCTTFKHSPVFRVGGDEFCVISRGEDYEHIDELVHSIKEHNRQALLDGGVVIACGMARYNGEDSISAVYEKADNEMYDNKISLKEGREVR